jgi:putative ABC transport system permease protein
LKQNKTIPPKLAKQLLLRFLRDDLAEEVQGDLEENFCRTAKEKSFLRARLNYWYQVVNYIRPFALRKTRTTDVTQFDMFQNYFKIGIRNLKRQKLYSFINIGGLCVGLTSFILIALYVQHEFSYDRFYENADRMYRIYQRQVGNIAMGSDYFALTPTKLASVLREEYPIVEHATALSRHSGLLNYEGNHFLESGLWVDPQFFDVFSYPFKHGNPQKSLTEPKSIILTESLSLKIFGPDDPVGKTLIHQSGIQFLVTGVLFDPPENASIKFSFLINMMADHWFTDDIERATWNGNSIHTFVVLRNGVDPKELEEKFPDILKKYRDKESYAEYPFEDQYILQNISKIHLQSKVNEDIGVKGNSLYVYIFCLVAIGVLLLACINYMNLAIARSVKRAREVGLRKVSGAIRKQIMGQFLGESTLISFLALLLALGLAYMLLPLFGNLVERPLKFDFIENKFLLPALLLLIVLVGLISGSYPAFVISSLRPIHVLKGKIEGKLSGFRLQRWLMIGQYAVSIALVVCSLVIYLQLRFVKQKELGYNKEHVIAIRSQGLVNNYDVIKNEWLANPDIIAVTASSDLPTNIGSSTIINYGGGADDDVAIYRWRVDQDFLKVFGIQLIAGRNFEASNITENGYIINETAARALGWTPQEAIGNDLNYSGGKSSIIGVVKDFHIHSMHLAIQPLMIMPEKIERWGYVTVKVRPENLTETIAFLERTTKKYSEYPFVYQFLDENYDQLYKSEISLGEIFGFFTILSILIASLGLFGQAAFTSAQRTQEIGIRKVLGASIGNLVFLLTKEYLVLVVLAFLISIPIAWYAMHNWLQTFAYRINLEWWVFASAGLLAFFIANLAIGYQSVKASLMNPVQSLRSE